MKALVNPPVRCSRCETLPEKVSGAGTLHLWCPLGHSAKKVQLCVRRGGHPYEIDEERISVQLNEAQPRSLLSSLSQTLTAAELDDTRALLKPEGGELSPRDFAKVQSLRQLVTLSQSSWLVDMLSEGRLTTLFQPIVFADRPTEVYAQECLLRGVDADGGLVSPKLILEAAADSGMLFQMDLAARRTTIAEATRHGLKQRLFINFTPTSIYDPTFCLRSTVHAIDAAGIAHEDIVFEVIEAEKTTDVRHLQNILNYYREAGFRVALDDVGAGYSSLNLIHQLRPDFIKLDMELVQGVTGDPYKAMIAEKLLEIAQCLGIGTIAEGVETREELEWARAHGATYVQGYHIARPSAPPVTVLNTGQRQAAVAAG